MNNQTEAGLTGAEIEMLRALPQRLANQAPGRGVESRDTARRARLQAAGLLSVRWEAAENCFLVMITPAGAAALPAKRGPR